MPPFVTTRADLEHRLTYKLKR